MFHSAHKTLIRTLTKWAIPLQITKNIGNIVKVFSCQILFKYIIKKENGSNFSILKKSQVQSSNQVSYPDKTLSMHAFWVKVSLCKKSTKYVLKQGHNSIFSFSTSDEISPEL